MGIAEKERTLASERAWQLRAFRGRMQGDSVVFETDNIPFRGLGPRAMAAYAMAGSLGASLLVFYLFPFNVPNKPLFSILIGLLSSVLSLWLLAGVRIRVVFRTRFSQRTVLFLLTLTILIMAIVLHAALDNVVLTPASPLYLISFASTALLTFYLPGRLLIEILRNSLTNIEKHTYAIVLSTLISGSAGFFSMILGSVESYSAFSLEITILIILSIVVVYSVVHRKELEPTRRKGQEMKLNLMTALIGFLTLCFLYLVYATLHASFQLSPVPILSDEWFHVGYILKLLQGNLPWQEANLGEFTAPAYPYLFHLSVGTGSSLSHLPVVDFLILSSILLIPLPTVAFYSLSKTLTKDTFLSVISLVVFTFFSGFGWIVAVAAFGMGSEILVISGASLITSDIIFSTWLPIIVAPYLLDLAILFSVVNLTLKMEIESKQLVALLIPLLLVSILAHLEKAVLLAALFAVLALLQIMTKTRNYRVAEFGIALLISAIVVVIWDLSAPRHFFTSSMSETIALLILASLGIVFLSMTREVFRRGLPITGFAQHARKLVILSLLVFAAISLYEFYAEVGVSNQLSVIPLYLIPSKLGLAAVFFLVLLYSLSSDDIQKWESLATLILAVITVELILYHLPLPVFGALGVFVEEFRFIRDITWPVIAIASSIGIARVSLKVGTIKFCVKWRPLTRILLGGFLIGLVISSASLSHMLKIEHQLNYSGGDENAYGMLTFLGNITIPTGSAIFADPSVELYVYAVTGIITYSPRTSVYGKVLSSSADLLSTLFVLQYLNISYIVARETVQGPALAEVTKYAQRIYEDDIYVVYKLPSLSQPSQDSTTAFMFLQPEPPIADILGQSLDYPWVEDFETVSGWTLDEANPESSQYEFSSTTNGTARFAVEGLNDTKIVVFLSKSFDEPVLLRENTYFWLRFRTKPTSSLVVHIQFEDGTSTNALLDGSPFLRNENWIWCATKIPKAEGSVTGIRVGVTNRLFEYDNRILVELDFACITYRSADVENFLDVLALTGVEFFTTHASEYLLTESLDTILLYDDFDEANSSAVANLTQAMTNRNRIIVFGNLPESKWMRSLVNITYTNQSVSLNSIYDGHNAYPIPSLEVPEFTIIDGNVSAWYSGDGLVPLVLRLPLEEQVDLIYVNVFPLLRYAHESENQTDMELIPVALRIILVDLVALPLAEEMERRFYIKNIGPISIEGNASIVCKHLILPDDAVFQQTDANTSCKLSILGEFQLNAQGFGFVSVTVNSNARIFLNGRLLELSDENRKLILAPGYITGFGIVEFSSLWSSHPFSISLSGERYVSTGEFSFGAIPLSNDIVLISPQQVQGFTSGGMHE